MHGKLIISIKLLISLSFLFISVIHERSCHLKFSIYLTVIRNSVDSIVFVHNLKRISWNSFILEFTCLFNIVTPQNTYICKVLTPLFMPMIIVSMFVSLFCKSYLYITFPKHLSPYDLKYVILALGCLQLHFLASSKIISKKELNQHILATRKPLWTVIAITIPNLKLSA